jgi:hypothetical protein
VYGQTKSPLSTGNANNNNFSLVSITPFETDAAVGRGSYDIIALLYTHDSRYAKESFLSVLNEMRSKESNDPRDSILALPRTGREELYLE